MKGLKWGRERVIKARRTLIENNFIENKTTRDKFGKISKHYIILRYVYNPEVLKPTLWLDQTVAQPDCGFQDTNAFNEKKSALNSKKKSAVYEKEIYYTAPHTKLFEFWNTQPSLITHRKLTKDMEKSMAKALRKYSLDVLFETVSNYNKVLSSSKYFFDHKWSLTEFFQRGLSRYAKEDSGFLKFLPENKPLTKLVNSNYEEFKPICFYYTKLYNKNDNTYYGISLNEFDDIEGRMYDIDHTKEPKYWNFEDLEVVVAGLLFTKKSNPRPELLQKYKKLWKKWRPKFKSEAIKRLKYYENN
jgi:hypothetical protein